MEKEQLKQNTRKIESIIGMNIIDLMHINKVRKNSRLYSSMKTLIYQSYVTTGYSDQYRVNIWTDKVIDFCNKNNIPVHSGNIAPRGGANGEFVKINEPELNKILISQLINN